MNDRSTDPLPSPAHDPFAEEAGAYVLGALDEVAREAFAAHLPACAACRAAVADVADLPALLAKVPPEGLAEPPPSVLVGLLAAVAPHDGAPADPPVDPPAELAARRAARARRWWTGTGLVAAAAAGFVAAAGVLPLGDADAPAPGTTVALASTSGPVPVSASVALEEAAWGTRLTVTCTYRAADGGPYGGLPAGPVAYALVVHDAAGRAEQVATWTAEPGRELTVPAATGMVIDEIVRVEMRSGDDVVLAASV